MVRARPKVASKFDDEPLAHLFAVPLEVMLHTEADVVVAMDEVPQLLVLVLVDARCEGPLVEVVRLEVVPNGKFKPLSRVSGAIPAPVQ